MATPHAKMEASLKRFIEALKVFEEQLVEFGRRIQKVQDAIDRLPRPDRKAGPPTDKGWLKP